MASSNEWRLWELLLNEVNWLFYSVNIEWSDFRKIVELLHEKVPKVFFLPWHHHWSSFFQLFFAFKVFWWRLVLFFLAKRKDVLSFLLFHTIRKVKFLSKNSNSTKPQHFHESFTPFFLVKSKLSTAKKSSTTTFSRVFHQKNRQF